MTIPVRVVTVDDETYISGTDLLAWLDESIVDHQQGPISTALKLELSAKIGHMAGISPPA